MGVQSDGRHDKPLRYEIRVQGHLDSRWAAWFEGFSVTNEGGGTTVIRGPVPDQAALHGLLQKLRDLALPLVSVTRIETEQPDVPGIGRHQPSPPQRTAP